MHFGRVKPASQLHAPRVCSVYIKPIPGSRKWQASALCPNAAIGTIQSFRPGYCTLMPELRHLGKSGRGSRARTRDLRFWRPPLYQLSYTPAARLLFHIARQNSSAVFRFCNARYRRRSSRKAPMSRETIRRVTRDCFKERAACRPPFQICISPFVYSTMLATMPAPTVRPPSRMAKRSFSSMAIGTISSTSTVTLSPGITISMPSGSCTMPVTSVVRK